jgi:hypothetical protein
MPGTCGFAIFQMEATRRRCWSGRIGSCPRGESPLTYTLAITGRLSLGAAVTRRADCGQSASGLNFVAGNGISRWGTRTPRYRFVTWTPT